MRAQDRFDDLQYGVVSTRLDALRNEAAAERRARALKRLAACAERVTQCRERHFVLRLLPVLSRRPRPLA